MLLTEGQMSDYKGAALMFEAMLPAPVLLADRGYDADWFRQALAARGTSACIPSRKGRKALIPHDAVLYRRRHRIETCSVASRACPGEGRGLAAYPHPLRPMRTRLHVRHRPRRIHHLLDQSMSLETSHLNPKFGSLFSGRIV